MKTYLLSFVARYFCPNNINKSNLNYPTFLSFFLMQTKSVSFLIIFINCLITSARAWQSLFWFSNVLFVTIFDFHKSVTESMMIISTTRYLKTWQRLRQGEQRQGGHVKRDNFYLAKIQEKFLRKCYLVMSKGRLDYQTVLDDFKSGWCNCEMTGSRSGSKLKVGLADGAARTASAGEKQVNDSRFAGTPGSSWGLVVLGEVLRSNISLPLYRVAM